METRIASYLLCEAGRCRDGFALDILFFLPLAFRWGCLRISRTFCDVHVTRLPT